MVSMVKDKTDQVSWFSAKPILVGNFSNITAGTELESQTRWIQPKGVSRFHINYYFNNNG